MGAQVVLWGLLALLAWPVLTILGGWLAIGILWCDSKRRLT